MEQRTDEWYEIKAGKFSASPVYKLMGKAGLGKTGESYVLEKVAEHYGARFELDTYATQRGTLLEPYAREHYSKVYGEEVLEEGFKIASWCDEAGVSPDGLLKGKKKGVEFKCPDNAVFHVKYHMMNSNDDLLSLKSEYYWQIQMQMAVYDYPVWDFVSFHPDFSEDMRMFVLEIKADESAIKLLKSRVLEAVRLKHKFIAEIEKNRNE